MAIDAAALGWLAAKAVAIAALPLAYVALSKAPDKQRKLAWVTAFLTLDLIMFGSFTRLTDSGLGCPDWPGCYGHSNPLSAAVEIRAAETALPSGPVTAFKAWIEMLHRYFAMAVGFLIVVLTVRALARWRRERDARSARLAAFAAVVLGMVCLQGAFGAWTVTMKLQPIVVTAHLLGGMALLALLVWQAKLEAGPAPPSGAPAMRWLAAAGLALLVVQIALGGWVSSNYAVMACPDFPMCQGRWRPDMDFEHGFTLWRDLGHTGSGELIGFPALVAIHWVHRVVAVPVLIVLALVAWRASRHPDTARIGRWLAAILVLQVVTGLSNVVLQWPLALAVLHNGGAAMLTGLLVVLNYGAWRASG
jgi:cytochrome c oxidase assembly protein subunit 15